MKKYILILAALLAFNTAAYAADPVAITDIYADGTRVYVEASNGLANETELMLTVIRQGVADPNEALYSMTQKVTKGGEKFLFSVTIPDDKRGISGSGTYEVSLQNLNGDKVTKTIEYANTADVNAFINALKTAVQGVSNPNLAYEPLDDIIHAPENAGEVFSIGLDYALFTSKDAAVQNSTLNILYANGLSGLTAETLPPAFVKAFAVAVFNNGAKTEGIDISRLTYNNEAPDSNLVGQAVTIMDNSYTSLSEYETDFSVAYGLTTIKNARVDDMGEMLTAFLTETGLCGERIGRLTNLLASLQNKGYTYMVDAITQSGVTTVTQLEALLDEAYRQAVAGGGAGEGSGGGGGGGAAIGGTGNRVPVDGGSVGGATGSGSFESKVEQTMIFTDLLSNHWAAESVKWLKEKGIVSGTDTGAFEPDRQVTREEFTKMIVLASGISMEKQTADFADLQTGAWYVPYIGAAVDAGIVNGIGENQFGIGQNITRQDMAVMVKRALEIKGAELVKVKAYTAFGDEASFAEYAQDAIKALYEAGVINGKGENSFDPAGMATRAEAAKIIYEAFK